MADLFCACFTDGKTGGMLQALHHNLVFILLGCSDYKSQPASQEVFSSRNGRESDLYPLGPGAKTLLSTPLHPTPSGGKQRTPEAWSSGDSQT